MKDLSFYVSNLDRDIYTVSNLPEEVIATVFAYVSRSSKSFRENLLRVSQEKASSFHEKWVLNYGHASVAELATVHFGIERVSRLFSSVLELSNPYISPIEYSQRYQKVRKGDFYTPLELNDNFRIRNEYVNFQNRIYDYYIQIFNILTQFYQKQNLYSKLVIEKKAFEDARYVLPLATLTNLGLTANARAMEDALKVMLSSEYLEVRNRALEIKQESRNVLPTLIKYADRNDFICEFRKKTKFYADSFLLSDFSYKKNAVNLGNDLDSNFVNLIYYSHQDFNQEEIIRKCVAKFLYSSVNSNFKAVNDFVLSLAIEKVYAMFNDFMNNLDSHDNPPNILKEINYEFEIFISESCWHQFLRHRKIIFKWQYPSSLNGYILPEVIGNISEARNIFITAMNESRDIFLQLENHFKSFSFMEGDFFTASHYTVTNAHYRKIIANFSLWELYHLINLRMTPQAQQEISILVSRIFEAVRRIHSVLIDPAIKRLYKRYPKIFKQ